MTRRVLCFGNDLHGDDGVGPAVGQRLLERGDLPPDWEVHIVGTQGLDALDLMLDSETVLLVDACAPAGQPGALHELDPDRLAAEATPIGHGQGLGYALGALRACDAPAPAQRLLAVEMAAVTPFRPTLSEPVAQAVDAAADRLRAWMEAPAHVGE